MSEIKIELYNDHFENAKRYQIPRMRFLILQKEQLQQIINHYGHESQKAMLFEEMAELQKEVCKELRGKGDKQHIAEELADVYVMLQQLQLMYGISDEKVEIEVQKKIERTLDRVEGECNESVSSM